MSELLRKCSKKHNKLTKEAAMGQGFDRHLFALKFLNGKLNGAPLPIFEDPAYAKLNYIVLSTSTLVSPALEVGGFAAVVPDGLGIGYAMFDDWFGTQASFYPPHNDGSGFIKELTGVCEDLKTVLTGKSFKEARQV
jgi:carnitine O-palmitoyltransferase 2